MLYSPPTYILSIVKHLPASTIHIYVCICMISFEILSASQNFPMVIKWRGSIYNNSNQTLVVSVTKWEERGQIWRILIALRMENTGKCQQEFTLKKEFLVCMKSLIGPSDKSNWYWGRFHRKTFMDLTLETPKCFTWQQNRIKFKMKSLISKANYKINLCM